MTEKKAEFDPRQKGYDATLARIAGNVAGGMISQFRQPLPEVMLRAIITDSVNVAQGIVDEIKRRNPQP